MAPPIRQPINTEDALAWSVAAVRDVDDSQRLDRYADYYHGRHNLAFATPRFESAFGRLFRAFAYNRCGVVVDSMSDRLFVEGFEVPGKKNPEANEDGTLPSADPDPVEAAIRDIWEANRMDKRQGDVYADAATMGDGYVLVWPDPFTLAPTIWPQDPRHVRVRYSDEYPGLRILATKAWREGGKIRLNVYHPDRIERWVTEKNSTAGARVSPRAFIEYQGDDAGHEVVNPWGQVPVFHFPNNAPTGKRGKSELRDVIPLQDALNKTLADKLVAMEFAAFPQRVLIGVEVGGEDDTHIETMNVGQAPMLGGASNALSRRQVESFQGGVSRVLALANEAAKVAEFSAVDLTQFIQVAEFFDSTISRASRIPVHYLTLAGDFPSGRALRTAEAPFVAKLEDRQRGFGNVWEDAIRLSLEQAGMPYDGPLSCKWRSAAPMAEEDTWDLVVQQVTAGVPLEIALEGIWDPEKIARLQASKANAMQQQIEIVTAGRMAGQEDLDEQDEEDAAEDGPRGQ